MSEINKAGPETPISLVVPVMQVPEAELKKLGLGDMASGEIAKKLLGEEKRIELYLLRKHLPDPMTQEDTKNLYELMKNHPEAQYLLVHRPAVKENQVRQLTLVSAFVGLIKATNNFNHFDTSPEGVEALREHTKQIVVWWPDYGTFLADARVRILLAVRVMLKLYPNIVESYPDRLGEQTVAGQVFLSCRDKWLKGGIDDPLPESLQGVWDTEAYWKDATELANRIGDKRNEMYNLDVERRKNPGHYKVGNQWLPYGTTYDDGRSAGKMVVVNHNTVKLGHLELFAQQQENRLAVMPLADAQPAIDKINEAGGSMFAAICRHGFKAVETWVDECCKPEDLVKVIENRRNAEGEQPFRSPVSETVPLDSVTDEELATVIHPPSRGENETLREAFARMIARGCSIEWWAATTLASREKVLAGEMHVRDIEGAVLSFKVPDGFYDGCKKLDHGADRILEEMDKHSATQAVRVKDGVTYHQYDHDPKQPAQDRVVGGWLNPWDINTPYRPGAVMFVTWPEISLLDANPETRSGGQRHYHSSSLQDGDTVVEKNLDEHVIIRPESAEKYKAICDRLRPIRRAVMAVSRPVDPYWPKEQQLKHYIDLGYTAGEALDLYLRSKLMRELNRLFKGADLDLEGIAKMTGFTTALASEWRQGHVDLWSLEELTELDEKVRKAFQEINENKQKE